MMLRFVSFVNHGHSLNIAVVNSTGYAVPRFSPSPSRSQSEEPTFSSTPHGFPNPSSLSLVYGVVAGPKPRHVSAKPVAPRTGNAVMSQISQNTRCCISVGTQLPKGSAPGFHRLQSGLSRARPWHAPAPSHRRLHFAMASASDERDMPPAPAAAHAPAAGRGRAGRPRGRGANRPRIDIDDQIAEANRLSSVMKKLAHAAKMAEKNGQRVKQRLMKKAGKLSAEDLERIAVLKRCGLVERPCQDAADPGSDQADGEPETPPKRRKAPQVNAQLATALGKVSGVESVIDSVGSLKTMMQDGSTSTGSALSSAYLSRSGSASSSGPARAVPRLARLPSASLPDLPSGVTADMESQQSPIVEEDEDETK